MDRILEASASYRNLRVVLLAGGVGGARMARGLAEVVTPENLTVVVNVGDDSRMYGTLVCADLDTVTYTLAGIEGPHGWGVANDSTVVMEHLGAAGVDTTFTLGDRDLAHCMARTAFLESGGTLAEFTTRAAERMGIGARILPASNDPIRTKVHTADGERLDFQDYFVVRGQRDRVVDLEYLGAAEALPAPGVLEALAAADVVVIAPSNPPLSIWPMLAIGSFATAVAAHHNVVAVSPLIGGAAVKGPLVAVMDGLGRPATNAGIADAYREIGLRLMAIHESDGADAAEMTVDIIATDTLIPDAPSGARLAIAILDAAIGADAAQ